MIFSYRHGGHRRAERAIATLWFRRDEKVSSRLVSSRLGSASVSLYEEMRPPRDHVVGSSDRHVNEAPIHTADGSLPTSLIAVYGMLSGRCYGTIALCALSLSLSLSLSHMHVVAIVERREHASRNWPRCGQYTLISLRSAPLRSAPLRDRRV